MTIHWLVLVWDFPLFPRLLWWKLKIQHRKSTCVTERGVAPAAWQFQRWSQSCPEGVGDITPGPVQGRWCPRKDQGVPSDKTKGYPPLDKTKGYPSRGLPQTRPGTGPRGTPSPPPVPVNRQTNWKQYLPASFGMRAVTKYKHEVAQGR